MFQGFDPNSDRRNRPWRNVRLATRRQRFRTGRRGAATLDYVLVMGIILPLATFLFWACPRIMAFVYNMTCVQWSWPFP